MLREFLRRRGENKTKEDNPNEIPKERAPYLIKACIGTYNSFDSDSWENFISLDAVNVDWRGNLEEQRNTGQKNSGKIGEYIISNIDDNNKKSYGYINCTGLVVSGISKETGKNISLLTHQNPLATLYEAKEIFTQHLNNSLSEFMGKIDTKTVDAVVFGGNFFQERPLKEGRGTLAEEYIGSVRQLEEILEKHTDISPQVIIGPNMDFLGEIDVAFDTKNKRLYIVRSDQPIHQNSTGSFPTSSVERESKKWETK